MQHAEARSAERTPACPAFILAFLRRDASRFEARLINRVHDLCFGDFRGVEFNRSAFLLETDLDIADAVHFSERICDRGRATRRLSVGGVACEPSDGRPNDKIFHLHTDRLDPLLSRGSKRKFQIFLRPEPISTAIARSDRKTRPRTLVPVRFLSATEARRHEPEFTPTENGGSRWSVTGNNGCIARVNFPAPALVSHIESEGETFDQILALGGKAFDRLFAWVNYLRSVPEFREEVVATLPGREAGELIELCQTTSSPRVSFETAQGKNPRSASEG